MAVEKEKKEKKPKSKARKILEWVLTGIFVALFAVVGIAQIDGLVNKNKHYNQQIRFGYATFVVQTDSMEPVYKTKSAIITYLDDADKIYQDYLANKEINVTFYDGYTATTEYTVPLKEENSNLVNRTVATQVPMTHQVKEIHVNPSFKKGEGKYVFITAGINKRSTNMGWKEGDPDLVINQYQAFTEKELLGRVVVNSDFLGGVFRFISSIWGLLILLLIPSFYLIIVSVIDIFKAYKEPDEPVAASLGGGASSSSGSKELSEEDKKRLKEELLQEMLNGKKGGNN